MRHPQIHLPELGFSVDEGLEDLIRACWHRGLATTGCCIEQHSDDEHEGETFIGFWYPTYRRWEPLTGLPIQTDFCGVNDLGQASYGFANFPREQIPDLVRRLREIP